MTIRPEPHLAEVSEEDAGGRIADLYDDIRRVTGVDSVALVYRALAAIPGALETVWSDLASNLADRDVRAAAARIVGADPASVAQLDPGLVSVPPRDAAATLAGFARINRLNLVGLNALFEGVPGRPPTIPARSARDIVPAGLPMADLGSLPENTRALLEAMSAPVAGEELPVVIPSLYRFFAHDERLLRVLWAALQPVVVGPAFGQRVAAIGRDAAPLARTLPYSVRQMGPGEGREVIERFLGTIPSMIVVGDLLGQALGLTDET